MCTGLIQKAKVTGAGKAADGWFKLDEVSVAYDCTYHTSLPQGLNIDFFSEKEAARVAVELSPASAMELVHAIMESIYSAGLDPGEVALGMSPGAEKPTAPPEPVRASSR